MIQRGSRHPVWAPLAAHHDPDVQLACLDARSLDWKGGGGLRTGLMTPKEQEPTGSQAECVRRAVTKADSLSLEEPVTGPVPAYRSKASDAPACDSSSRWCRGGWLVSLTMLPSDPPALTSSLRQVFKGRTGRLPGVPRAQAGNGLWRKSARAALE